MLYLLIDGDMVCFRVCASVEHEIEWGNDIWTLHVDLNEAKERYETIKVKILFLANQNMMKFVVLKIIIQMYQIR